MEQHREEDAVEGQREGAEGQRLGGWMLVLLTQVGKRERRENAEKKFRTCLLAELHLGLPSVCGFNL